MSFGSEESWPLTWKVEVGTNFLRLLSSALIFLQIMEVVVSGVMLEV